MTRDEVQALLNQMEGVSALMAGLMYGGGLWIMECVRLRVKVVDFGRHQIMVRDGRGFPWILEAGRSDGIISTKPSRRRPSKRQSLVQE